MNFRGRVRFFHSKVKTNWCPNGKRNRCFRKNNNIPCRKLKSHNLQYESLSRSSHLPSIWWSKYYLDILKIKQWVAGFKLGAHKTLYFYFCKVIRNGKINWKDFCKTFCKKLWIKMILGTSYPWSMRWLSHQTSNPA